MNIPNRDPVDLIGEIKAKIADLEQQESELRKMIAARGPGAYEGELFRATVSVSEREHLDMKAVREKLSRQFIAANSKTIKVVTVSVRARTGEEVVR